MLILWNNKTETANIEIEPLEVGYTSQPITNYHLSRVSRIDGNSGEILISFSEPEEIEWFILETNSKNLEVILHGNTTDDFDNPAYEKEISQYGTKSVGEIKEVYQFWRVTFVDITLDYIDLKYLSMGDVLQMPPMTPGINFDYETTSVVTTNMSGQTYGDKGFEIFNTGFSFPNITEYERFIDEKRISTKYEILEVWRYLQNIKPFYLIIYEKDLEAYPPILGLFTDNSFNFSYDGENRFSLSFDFRETK